MALLRPCLRAARVTRWMAGRMEFMVSSFCWLPKGVSRVGGCDFLLRMIGFVSGWLKDVVEVI